MSITSIFDFASGASFALEQAIVQAGEGSLDHEDTLRTWTEDFADDTGFTYDNTKAEFTGGLVRQKDLSPVDSIIGAIYDASADANWNKNGATAAVLNGTPTIVSGKLQCHGVHGLRYVANYSGIGTIKFKFTPNYNTVPAVNINLVGLHQASGNQNRIVLTHSPSGSFRITLNNSSGTAIYNANQIGANPTVVSGTEYEVELNWDNVTGIIRFFWNGTLHATLAPGAWAHGSGVGVVHVGADATAYNTSNASFNDVLLFSTVQHTSGYTTGYSITEYIYAGSSVVLPQHVHSVPGQDISSLTSLVVTEVGSPRYIIEGKYWNGSAWVASNGSYAQANSATDANTNIASLGLLTGDNTIDASILFPNSNTLSSVANLAIGHMAGTHYESGSIETGSALSIQSIASFAASITEPANTTLRFQLRIDGVLKYHNGSAWVNSDGSTTQGNTAAQINNNVGSLALGSNSSVKIRIAMATTDIEVSPSIDEMTIVYDFGGVGIEPTTCIVWGYYKDISGEPVSGAVVTFALSKNKKQYKEASSNIIEKSVSVTTDANGYFEVDLIRSSQFEGSGTYKITIVKEADELNTSRSSADAELTFSVPDAVDKNVTDLFTAA